MAHIPLINGTNRLVLRTSVHARHFLAPGAAFSLGLPLAGASPGLPSTPAGKVLAGYLEALNSGNKDKLEAFIPGPVGGPA